METRTDAILSAFALPLKADVLLFRLEARAVPFLEDDMLTFASWLINQNIFV